MLICVKFKLNKMKKMISVLLFVMVCLSSCSDPNENKKVRVIKTINEIENDTIINVSKKLSLYDNVFFILKFGFDIQPDLIKNDLIVESYTGERSGLSNDKLIILFENNKRIILFNYKKDIQYKSYFKLSINDINTLSKFKVKKIQYSTNIDNSSHFKQTFNIVDNT